MFSILFDIVNVVMFLEMRYYNLYLLYIGGMTMEEQYETDFYNPYEDMEFLRKLRKEENPN